MIYFDNAATTYPKPQSVIKATIDATKNYSFNSGRGGYNQSIKAAEAIYDVREKIGEFFNFSPENIIFTNNCTQALNMAIKGSVKNGDHVIISSLEHNSVVRVVKSLADKSIIEYSVVKYSFDLDEILSNFENTIKDNTTAVICTHSSNVFGVSFPISSIGKLCKEKGIRFIVDAAQGAGIADIDAKRDNIDILCAPGHKCIYGNMGTGFMALSDNISLDTILEGGTGSTSLSLFQPEFTPDRFESGTLNNSGIISMGAGIDFINRIGREKIYSHEMKLAKKIYNDLKKIEKIKLYTPIPKENISMPIVSFNVVGYQSEEVANILANNNICTRAGLHCSPSAHNHFGTIDTGVVRISFGVFNNEKECNSLINVVKKL